MQWSIRSECALKLMMYLATHSDERNTIDGVADARSLSRGHLSHVVYHLARAGFIETRRGQGGGLFLTTAPEEISLGALLRYTEKTGDSETLGPVLDEAYEAFFKVLDPVTLKDLIGH